MKTYKISYQYENTINTQIIKTDNIKNEKLPKNIIKIKEIDSKTKLIDKNKISISNKNINLIIYELNLMLQAGINFSQSLDILIKNKKDTNTLLFLETIKKSFANGKDINQNLKNFNINMLVKIFLQNSQYNSNLSSNINALNILLKEQEKIRKSFLKSISYPIFLFISFFISLFVIFSFVIPKFESIFFQTKNELPVVTKVLIYCKDFFENYFFYLILLFILLLSLLLFMYKKYYKIGYLFDKLIIKNFPILKDIILSYELYKFFLLIEIMLCNHYEFYKSFISSKVLLRNKYLLDRIFIIDNLLQNGKSISYSFSNALLFDEIVLNLLNTGEISNSLNLAVAEIKTFYKNIFDDKINFLILIIQPIFLFAMFGLILLIILGIFMPIWNMGSMINI